MGDNFIQFQLTEQDLLDDSKKILLDILKLLKEQMDPQFEEVDMVDQVQVVLAKEEGLTTGKQVEVPIEK